MAEATKFGPIQRKAIDTADSGDTVIQSAVAGAAVRIYSVCVIADAAVSVKFNDSATDMCGDMALPANGGFVWPHNPHGWGQGAVGNELNINLSGAVQVSGVITYAVGND